MPKPPLVSVLLPVRNAAGTIDAAIESVLAQTFADFELLVVDDGSTDGTGERLARQAARDRRVIVLTSDARGTTIALNSGAAIARGRYLARQDADDLSAPSRFERQLQYLEAHPRVAAVGTVAMAMDADGRDVSRLPTRHGVADVRAGILSVRATPVHGSIVMRRDAFEAVGGYRAAFTSCQDFDLWLRLLERYEIDNLDDCLYRWRLSGGDRYPDRRRIQLMFGGVGLAFAEERRRYGSDSYALLEASHGDFEAFARQFRLAGLVRASWGELLLRGLNDPHLAHRHFWRAVRSGHLRPRTLALCAWTWLGLPWIGGKPLTAPVETVASR